MNILVIGFHTNEKFMAKKRARKLIEKYKNVIIFHVALCYNHHHYLFWNNIQIEHLQMSDHKQAYYLLIHLVSTLQKTFRLITFWGHGGGPVFGSKSLILSAYDFAKPLLNHKISSFLLWLEGCNLGNIITLLDCYKISQYMVGVSNSYGGNTVISHLSHLELDTKKQMIGSFKKICKIMDPLHTYCYFIYKTKHTPLLIDYLSSVELSSLSWEEKNIKKKELNVYNLSHISPDPKLHLILDKLIAFNGKKCFLNIDKFIYSKIYAESLRNTYYKILNKNSKKFYISQPQSYE